MYVSDTEPVFAVLPLGENFGLVTADYPPQLHIVSIRDLDLACELTQIFLSPSRSQPGLPTVVGVCLRQPFANQRYIYHVFLTINVNNLSASSPPYVDALVCATSAELSEFFYLESTEFPSGVLVFVDNGEFWYQPLGESCQLFYTICHVEHVIVNSPTSLAAYCSGYVLFFEFPYDDVVHYEKVFEVPSFCSEFVFSSYEMNTFTLYEVREWDSSIISSVFFPYGNDVMSGICVPLGDEFIVVVQLTNGTVLTSNFNTSKTEVIGASIMPPRVYQQYVQLTMATRMVVHNLSERTSVLTMELWGSEEVVAMGTVLEIATISVTVPEPTSYSTTVLVVGVVLCGIAAILIAMVTICCVCIVRVRLNRKSHNPLHSLLGGVALPARFSKSVIQQEELQEFFPPLIPPPPDPQDNQPHPPQPHLQGEQVQEEGSSVPLESFLGHSEEVQETNLIQPDQEYAPQQPLIAKTEVDTVPKPPQRGQSSPAHHHDYSKRSGDYSKRRRGGGD